jgi:hypothetical protein
MAAVTLAAYGALVASIAASSVAKAFGVNWRAASFTSAMTFRASIVSDRFGLPLRLPLWPRFQEVDLRPPFGIAWFRLFCWAVLEGRSPSGLPAGLPDWRLAFFVGSSVIGRRLAPAPPGVCVGFVGVFHLHAEECLCSAQW